MCVCVSPRTGPPEGGVMVLLMGGSGGPCVCVCVCVCVWRGEIGVEAHCRRGRRSHSLKPPWSENVSGERTPALIRPVFFRGVCAL